MTTTLGTCLLMKSLMSLGCSITNVIAHLAFRKACLEDTRWAFHLLERSRKMTKTKEAIKLLEEAKNYQADSIHGVECYATSLLNQALSLLQQPCKSYKNGMCEVWCRPLDEEVPQYVPCKGFLTCPDYRPKEDEPPPCEICGGLKVVCKDGIGLMFGGVAAPCPDCSPSGEDSIDFLLKDLGSTPSYSHNLFKKVIKKMHKKLPLTQFFDEFAAYLVSVTARTNLLADQAKTITAQAEQIKGLKERIEFAVEYLPESPDKALRFLTPVLGKKGE